MKTLIFRGYYLFLGSVGRLLRISLGVVPIKDPLTFKNQKRNQCQYPESASTNIRVQIKLTLLILKFQSGKRSNHTILINFCVIAIVCVDLAEKSHSGLIYTITFDYVCSIRLLDHIYNG